MSERLPRPCPEHGYSTAATAVVTRPQYLVGPNFGSRILWLGDPRQLRLNRCLEGSSARASLFWGSLPAAVEAIWSGDTSKERHTAGVHQGQRRRPVHLLMLRHSFNHLSKGGRTVGSGMGKGQPCWGQPGRACPRIHSIQTDGAEPFHRKETRWPHISEYTAHLLQSRNGRVWGGQSDRSAPHDGLMKKTTCKDRRSMIWIPLAAVRSPGSPEWHLQGNSLLSRVPVESPCFP